jgi:hypothetical protein
VRFCSRRVDRAPWKIRGVERVADPERRYRGQRLEDPGHAREVVARGATGGRQWARSIDTGSGQIRGLPPRKRPAAQGRQGLATSEAQHPEVASAPDGALVASRAKRLGRIVDDRDARAEQELAQRSDRLGHAEQVAHHQRGGSLEWQPREGGSVDLTPRRHIDQSDLQSGSHRRGRHGEAGVGRHDHLAPTARLGEVGQAYAEGFASGRVECDRVGLEPPRQLLAEDAFRIPRAQGAPDGPPPDSITARRLATEPGAHHRRVGCQVTARRPDR